MFSASLWAGAMTEMRGRLRAGMWGQGIGDRAWAREGRMTGAGVWSRIEFGTILDFNPL